MSKRVFIIHGWYAYPQKGWSPWLKSELESKGFTVIVPSMPDTNNPKIEAWIHYLDKIVHDADEDTFFVGHSIGCQAILRFLETLPENKKIGGAVFVAGFFSVGESTLKGLTGEEKEIIKPWLETPLNFQRIKRHTDKFVAILSDNDYFVPLSNKDIFKEKLGAKLNIEHDMRHFSGDEGITQLPIALESLLEISD